MLIGITGGIGGGKSCVARRLARLLDASVFSADDICREFLEPGRSGYRAFIARFDGRFLDAQGNIDRSRLRRAAFEDSSIRGTLESILHPLVRVRLVEEKRRVADSEGFVVAEVPLLYECSWQEDFDWVVCVYLPAEPAAERVARRDRISLEEARAIIALQLPPEEKKKRADSVIDNRGTVAETDKQVIDLATFLRQRLSSGDRTK